jgi:hypothetical protein
MADSRRGPTRLMSIVPSLRLEISSTMPFNRQSTRSRFVTSTAMPARNSGNREETDCHAALNIREIVKSRVKNILSKFGADDRTHAARLILKRGIIQS